MKKIESGEVVADGSLVTEVVFALHTESDAPVSYTYNMVRYTYRINHFFFSLIFLNKIDTIK